uniref:Uncharacterized protein n=1 Tax=Avena sativa TaxID=4498 RepID=A0ACD5Z019_AVESA
MAMGYYFSLVAVVLVQLLFAGATDAARLYPTSQDEKFNTNGTSFLSHHAGLLQELADTDKSGSLITYWATHRMHAGDTTGYYGFSVSMDVYDFSLTSEQSSLALVNIFSATDGALSSENSIQIGWVVSPKTYGDSHAHLSAYWSTDGFQNSHCLNTRCPVGFQPEAGAAIVLGDIIEPVSQPNGIKQSVTIKVLKDGPSGDWLVHCGYNQDAPALIGRYPRSLFPGGLADRATHIHIGGAVVARSTDLVPMGSGYLPSTVAAASFNNFQIIDQNGQAWLVNHNVPGYLSQPETYSLSPIVNGQFFYGGPYQSTT